MESVSIVSAQPGQVIATAVTNADGAILCPPGFCLTEAAIDRLKRVGVETVMLKKLGGAQGRLQMRLAQLEVRFKGIEDPILLRIKEIIEKRLQFMLMDLDG